MKPIYLLFVFCLLSNISQTQTLEYLEKSTSVDMSTSHNFHASAYNDGYFYLAGEFWKDIAFGNFSIAFPAGEDDMVWSFILKVSEEGEVVDLWHFESDEYTRINQLVFDPSGETLTIVGQYRTNMIYNGSELNTAFVADGFVMNLNVDGSLNWSKQVIAQSNTSFASGEGLAIDANGNIFVGLEAGGTVDLEGTVFVYPEETLGALIVSLDPAGNVLHTQQWQMNGFETFIDITDMAIDETGKLVIGGGLTGEAQLGGVLFGTDSPTLQSFVIKENEDLSIAWAKQYLGGNSMVSNLLRFDNQLYISLEYANFLNIDDTQIIGSGSWRDLAIVAVDTEENSTLVQNFRLAENGGTSGVYANSMTEYLGNLYIGGMYQGVVINDDDFSLGITGNADFQFPFILSLNLEGAIVSSYDFWGSTGPSRLRTLSASEHRLLFGGTFTDAIRLAGESLETVNSTLFYGAFWDGVINSVFDRTAPATSCVQNVYPTVVKEVLYVDAIDVEGMWIIDATGKSVADASTATQSPRQIQVDHLVPGLYYLKITCGEGTETVKFFKR